MKQANRLYLLSFVYIVAILFCNQSAAAESFNQCSYGSAPRSELDHFCPRNEGTHLDGCCPPLFKDPPLQCRYAIILNRGQAYLTRSSYTTCEAGVNVQKSCCSVAQRQCFQSPVLLNYIPRLLKRNNSCCFENCPSASYWRAAPARPEITAQHETLISNVNECTGTVLQECSAGSVENCLPSDYCPVVDNGTGNNTGNGSGGSGSGGGGSNTAPPGTGSTPVPPAGTPAPPPGPPPAPPPPPIIPEGS